MLRDAMLNVRFPVRHSVSFARDTENQLRTHVEEVVDVVL